MPQRREGTKDGSVLAIAAKSPKKCSHWDGILIQLFQMAYQWLNPIEGHIGKPFYVDFCVSLVIELNLGHPFVQKNVIKHTFSKEKM